MTLPKRWSLDDIDSASGKVVLVTGATSGIGFEAALGFARKGARVLLGARNRDKARAAAERIQAEVPDAALDVVAMDLASLASVRAASTALHERSERLDVLCNNAGVMALPYARTVDGFELQLGTNHLGHFALTGLLLDRLLGTTGSRVVTVSSFAHHPGRIDFDDLQSERSYDKWRAYAQSKLANLLFMRALDRRLRAAGASTISVACHPGYAATGLQSVGPELEGSRVAAAIYRFANAWIAQDARMGALPTLCAALAPAIDGGDFIGPRGPLQLRGHPRRVGSSARARDADAAERLWRVSEELTGVRYELPEAG
jgi:NAD(P)-dependent dehydrogenase (short-subunit alcohol dehydrogenase family)